MAKMNIKKFSDPKAQAKWLVENQALLKAQRRSEPKKSDGMSFGFTSFAVNEKGERLKAESDDTGNPIEDKGVLKVKCIINATNILDSHRDLHIPGLWKKSLTEKKLIYLCKEHNLTFEGIISDEITAYTQNYTFAELGYPEYEGSAECLVFDAIIRKSRNEYMYDQYKQGFVRNHSIRMEYVKEYFCMRESFAEGEASYTDYIDHWNKYAPMCANQDDLDSVNWFYAVVEAKIKDEGSAVVKGSCFTTPTIELSDDDDEDIEEGQAGDKSLDEDKNEPDTSTQKSYYSSLI
ncbi:hypothetical protein [Epilithonimonas caeni]|uniref:hypothetical protein n=1 Tax=Epilithonimonas caeni TaxID=365343 RepID=UPI0012EB507D|nr:hypothetical protein [Epilithonimonas caeni]